MSLTLQRGKQSWRRPWLSHWNEQLALALVDVHVHTYGLGFHNAEQSTREYTYSYVAPRCFPAFLCQNSYRISEGTAEYQKYVWFSSEEKFWTSSLSFSFQNTNFLVSPLLNRVRFCPRVRRVHLFSASEHMPSWAFPPFGWPLLPRSGVRKVVPD